MISCGQTTKLVSRLSRKAGLRPFLLILDSPEQIYTKNMSGSSQGWTCGFRRLEQSEYVCLQEYTWAVHNSSLNYHIFRNFVSPELIENLCDKDEEEEALTPCVSKYGMISDAYSVGVTLSEIATGVPPGQDITTYVKANRKPMPKSQSKLSKLFCSSQSKGPHPIQLRLLGELPKPCSNLLSCLMNQDPTTRLSVREAQDHEYIGGYDSLEHGDVDSRSGSKCIPLQNIAAFKWVVIPWRTIS